MRLICLNIFLLISFSTFAADDYEKALVAYEKNKIDDAYIHLKNALKYDDNTLSAKILMGKVLFQKGNYIDGIREFEEALLLGGDINLFISDLGNALMLVKNYQRVISLPNENNLSNVNNVTALLLSGNAYALLEDDQNTENSYRKALNLAPTDSRVLLALAAFKLEKNDLINAQKFIDKLIQLTPNDSRVWNLKGQLYKAKNEKQKSLKAFQKGHEISPEDPFIQRSLAHAYTDVGDYEQALKLVEGILIVTPDDAFAKLLKSQLLNLTNDSEAAAEVLSDISNKLSLLTDEDKASNVFLSYIAGTAAFLQNNDELALKELRLYLREKPEDLATINMIVNILLRQQDIDGAQELLELKEYIIMEDISLSLTLFNIYLQKNKLYTAELFLKLLNKKYKNNSQLLLAQTRYFSINKQFDKAIQLLEDNKPDSFDANYLFSKGLIYREQGELEKASKIADELIILAPENSNFLAFKGSLLLQSQQWLEAIKVFEKSLAILPNHFISEFNIATAYAALQQPNEAKVFTDKLSKVYPDNVALKVLIAKLARDTGDIKLAINTLNEALKIDGTNVSALETLADLYYQTGDYELALTELNKLTKLIFLNPDYLKQKALIFIALKQADKAIKELDILLGLSSTVEQLYELSDLYLRLNNYHTAKKILESALLKSPENIRIKLSLARVELTLNNIQQATKYINSAGKGNWNDPNVLAVNGELLLKKKKYHLAQKKFIQALRIDNNFNKVLIQSYQLAITGISGELFESTVNKILVESSDNYFMRNLLADYYLNTGDKIKAIEHYKTLIDIENGVNKASILNNLANIFIDLDTLEAEKFAKQAYDLNDSTAAILDTYGWTLTLNNKLNEGLALLRQSYSMNSNSSSVAYHIAYTLDALGRKDEALKELKQLLSLPDDFSEKKKAQQLFEQLSQ